MIDGTSYDLITSKFVGRYDNTAPRLLSTFNVVDGTFDQNADLFPDKTASNLEERVVRFAIFNYKPYGYWKEVVRNIFILHSITFRTDFKIKFIFQPEGQGNSRSVDTIGEKNLFLDGTEGLIGLTFCGLYNCTLEVVHGLS